MHKEIHRDVWVGAFLLIFCAVALFFAVRIPGEASYLPVALIVLMILCALFIVMKGLRMTKAHNEEDFRYSLTLKDSRNAFFFMLIIAIYYFLFRYVTYWIATPVFMIYAMKHLKVKSWVVNIVITVLYVAISYIVFVVILKLPIYRVGALGRYFRFV